MTAFWGLAPFQAAVRCIQYMPPLRRDGLRDFSDGSQGPTLRRAQARQFFIDDAADILACFRPRNRAARPKRPPKCRGASSRRGHTANQLCRELRGACFFGQLGGRTSARGHCHSAPGTSSAY